MTRRTLLGIAFPLALASLSAMAGAAGAQEKQVTKYARFQIADRTAYGIVEGDQVRELSGDLFGQWSKTEKLHPLKGLTLLAPSRPTQVFALAGNYRSHLTKTTVPEKFKIPQPFLKTASCIIGPEQPILLPTWDEQEIHFEGELVLVIGRTARDVPKDRALDYVLGATCGNDVSARSWQRDDIQWWRAKGSDTFGPTGPFLVGGIDYDNLLLQTRVNGEVKQKQSTRDLIHDCATLVSTISRHVTLQPGDMIFTGTPGTTGPIKAGDVVEIDIEGIGVLRNPVRNRE